MHRSMVVCAARLPAICIHCQSELAQFLLHLQKFEMVNPGKCAPYFNRPYFHCEVCDYFENMRDIAASACNIHIRWKFR